MRTSKRSKADTGTGNDLERIAGDRKSTKYCSQLRAIEFHFSEEPRTMLEVAKLSGIERAGICRYISTLRKQDRIERVRFGICSISKHRAGDCYSDRRGE